MTGDLFDEEPPHGPPTYWQAMGLWMMGEDWKMDGIDWKIDWKIESLTSEVLRLQRENNTLRSIVAVSDYPCLYCGLELRDMKKCASGFPGCARADDMSLHPDFGILAEDDGKGLEDE